MISPTPPILKKNSCVLHPKNDPRAHFENLRGHSDWEIELFQICLLHSSKLFYYKNDHSDQTKPPTEPQKVPKDSSSWAFQRGWWFGFTTDYNWLQI